MQSQLCSFGLHDEKLHLSTSDNKIYFFSIMKISLFILFLLKTVSSQLPDTDVEENSTGWYQIEGKVYPPELGEDNWQEDTQIIINGGKVQSINSFARFRRPAQVATASNTTSSLSILGEIKGFLRNDGTFVISKVPSGSSYVIEILNPNYLYEPVRVEINNKGKFRARKVNVSAVVSS